jgi:uncharacterized protein YqeY
MSTLEDRLMADLKDAMRAGPTAERRKETIRFLRSAIHNLQIELGRPLTDAEVEDVLRRQVKQRRDSIEAFTQAHRPELAQKEQEELEIIQHYLPQQMSEAEVEAAARAVIAATGAQSVADLNKVMPVLTQQLKGRAEGRLINQVVRRLIGS